ncbi:MAG: DUF2207 family protein, partial [Candidatus Limnocylindrales bacterium]
PPMELIRHRPYRAALAGLLLSVILLPLLASMALASGPPYPDPVAGKRVYDTAEIFDPATIASAQATISAIEGRTGAQVVVYSEIVDYGISSDEAEANAQALMDQWGVGRKGFDDGLVILFEIDPSRCHGQIQLYAGPGYRAAYLSNDQRDSIFNDDMLPKLEDCDMDGALTAGLGPINDAATPENAANLSRGRIINALIGLVLAPAIIILSLASVSIAWYRRGRDAVYLDDPSVLMPAPPPDLTPASAALVYDDRSSRRALTTAMLDLASRGEIAFDVPDPKHPSTIAIDLAPPAPTDPAVVASQQSAMRQKLTDAETYALTMLHSVGGDGERIESDEIPKFGTYTPTFNSKLEDHAVAQGWFVEAPTKAISRYSGRGGIELILGFVAFIFAASATISGLIFVAVGLLAGGAVSIAIAQAMPARTKDGAIINAQLKAYRRTLEATMAQARSMNEVVASAKLDWLDSPDRAVVWGVALDLNHEVQAVLGRTVEDVQRGVAASGAYFPIWYGSSALGGGLGGFGGGAAGAPAASIFSSGMIPNVGGMMAALGTIGSSPSSSGGGGGGGFGGGG